MDDLRDKVAFVTGSAGGIGLGIARALAEAGMKVALADIDKDALAEATTTLGRSGATVFAVPLDVTDRRAWQAAVDTVGAELGPIQVLANNAGVSTLGMSFEEISPEIWDKVVQINLNGVFNGVHYVLPQMQAAGSGHIVNTSSMGGLLGSVPKLSPYAATKFAVVGLSESLRVELAEENIGVSVLCPGGVRSRLWRTSRAIRGLPDTDVPPSDMSGQSAGPHGMDPDEVGLRVLDAVRNNELYVITHPEMRPGVVARNERLMAGFNFGETFHERHPS